MVSKVLMTWVPFSGLFDQDNFERGELHHQERAEMVQLFIVRVMNGPKTHQLCMELSHAGGNGKKYFDQICEKFLSSARLTGVHCLPCSRQLLSQRACPSCLCGVRLDRGRNYSLADIFARQDVYTSRLHYIIV